jgi:hypothetical protein
MTEPLSCAGTIPQFAGHRRLTIVGPELTGPMSAGAPKHALRSGLIKIRREIYEIIALPDLT